MSATTRAERAANDAVRAVVLAKEAAQEAQEAAQTVEQLAPNPQQQIIAEMAAHERAALLRLGPKRNRWSELQRYDEQLAEFEQRREQLGREVGELRVARNNEPEHLAMAIDAWIVGGCVGGRPQSQVAALDQQIADREAEHAAGIGYERLLAERAEHVSKNRPKMLGDIHTQVESAAGEYAALVDQLEAKRQELLDLRQTEVWTAVYPSATLANEPSTAALVGAKKRLQEPLLPGLQSGLVASAVFALLRANGRFCSTVSTEAQAAAERGVTVGELTRSDAKWLGDRREDLVGPRFASTWGGSDEEKAEAERVRDYQEQTKRRLWGE